MFKQLLLLYINSHSTFEDNPKNLTKIYKVFKAKTTFSLLNVEKRTLEKFSNCKYQLKLIEEQVNPQTQLKPLLRVCSIISIFFCNRLKC